MFTLTLLLACAHAPPVPTVADAPMNLGFEAAEGALPTGWSLGQGGFPVSTDTSTVRTGRHSVRITATPDGRYGSLHRRIDAAPLVGKQVRLHAWVKTEKVTGWPVSFIRVDGGESTYAFSDSPLGTTPGWSEIVADAMIAPGQDLTFGVAMGGDGSAWFDDLWLEVVEPTPKVPIQLGGRVVDPSGAPVTGAEVGLVSPKGAIALHTRSDADGGFTFSTTAGTWGLSVIAPGPPELVGTFLAQQAYGQAPSGLTLQLGAEGGATVEGVVEGMVPATGGYVQVAAYSKFDADIFAVPVDAAGRFAVTMPRADRYALAILSGGNGKGEAVREGDIARATLTATAPLDAPAAPTPASVVSWISEHAIPLSTVDPDAPLDDPAGLRALVGDAPVVALGEATHGTREFFQLKHRVFRSLVEDQGFTVFALEIGQVDARLINAIIQDGTGDARAALGAAGMWVWETEEVLAQIAWMRAWNADPSHRQKLQFVGFDAQSPISSLAAVRQFLEMVAPDEVTALLAPLDVLRYEAGSAAFEALSEPERDAVMAAVGALRARFETARGTWEAASGPAAYAVARQDARTLQQAAEQFALRARGQNASALRDAAMAENIVWLHHTLPPGTRMVVSAHNLHIADLQAPTVMMGHHLRAALGPKLLTVGLQLGDGTFQAIRPREDGAHPNIELITLPPPRPGQLAAALLAAGPPVYALDLRALPADGEVAAWFRSPQLVREVGYMFRSEAAMTDPQTLPERYDALLFVAHTTRARPLAVDYTRLP